MTESRSRARAALAHASGLVLGLTSAAAWAGCGFHLTSHPGSDGSGDEMIATIVDDAAQDFAGTLTGGVVATRGVIEPDAFVVGGLHARAFAGNLVVGSTSTYDGVIAAAGTMIGAGYRQQLADFAGDRPHGLGLPGSDSFTVVYDGEILLPAGDVMLSLAADDRALLEIAGDGSTFASHVYATASLTGTAMIHLDRADWYPIRAALTEDFGNARIVLSLITTSGTSGTEVVGADRLRSRVTADPGLIAFQFDGRGLLIPVGETTVPTVDESFGLGTTGFDLSSRFDDIGLRHAGQLRIDTPGTYTFTADVGADPDDSWRLWIDDELVANRWPPTPDKLAATLDLEPGWHDLLVDYAEAAGNAQVTLRMAGPGITDGPIDRDRLRPAVAFGLTSAVFDGASFPAITDATTGPGITTIPLALAAAAGAVIDSVDYGIGIYRERISDITLELDACASSEPLPITTVGYAYFAADRSCAGAPVVPATPWALRIVDSVPGNDPAYLGQPPYATGFALIATYHGGDRMPFASAVTYVSPPRPTPGALRIESVHVTADLRGAALAISVRTGADAAAVNAAAWVEVADGAAPAVDASELVQYKLEVAANGWQLATVDKVEISYAVPAS